MNESFFKEEILRRYALLKVWEALILRTACWLSFRYFDIELRRVAFNVCVLGPFGIVGSLLIVGYLASSTDVYVQVVLSGLTAAITILVYVHCIFSLIAVDIFSGDQKMEL